MSRLGALALVGFGAWGVWGVSRLGVSLGGEAQYALEMERKVLRRLSDPVACRIQRRWLSCKQVGTWLDKNRR